MLLKLLGPHKYMAFQGWKATHFGLYISLVFCVATTPFMIGISGIFYFSNINQKFDNAEVLRAKVVNTVMGQTDDGPARMYYTLITEDGLYLQKSARAYAFVHRGDILCLQKKIGQENQAIFFTRVQNDLCHELTSFKEPQL